MNALADLEPGDVPVWNPTENVKLEARGLAEDEGGPTIFTAEVETDAGLLAGIENLELVGATESTFYVAPLDKPAARRVHDDAIEAIEEAGGAVVDDKTEVPA